MSTYRLVTGFCLLVFLMLMVLEPAMANKFETISSGVNGLEQDKLKILKILSLAAGGFFLVLAAAVLTTRNRFEGFAGYSSGKELSIAVKGAIFLCLTGALFLGLGMV